MIISKLHVIVYITLYSRFCLSQVTCTSPCISQATSASTSQSHSPDQGGKVKASQWVKMLDLKTPTKNSQDVTFPELEDSAKKKKKKYKRYNCTTPWWFSASLYIVLLLDFRTSGHALYEYDKLFSFIVEWNEHILNKVIKIYVANLIVTAEIFMWL